MVWCPGQEWWLASRRPCRALPETSSSLGCLVVPLRASRQRVIVGECVVGVVGECRHREETLLARCSVGATAHDSVLVCGVGKAVSGKAASSRRCCCSTRSRKHCSIPQMQQVKQRRFAESSGGRVVVGILVALSASRWPAMRPPPKSYTYRWCA